jgi:ribonuclease HI
VKPRVIIYCDGACSPNPGAGGWGAVLISADMADGRRELSGAVPDTTNNRMELLGAIMALRALERPSEVALHTDSLYVHNAFKKGWIAKWRDNGWLNAARKPVENQDLWRALIELTEVHDVDWNWVRGHSGHPENSRCDELAVAARTMLAGARQLAVTVGSTRK